MPKDTRVPEKNQATLKLWSKAGVPNCDPSSSRWGSLVFPPVPASGTWFKKFPRLQVIGDIKEESKRFGLLISYMFKDGEEHNNGTWVYPPEVTKYNIQRGDAAAPESSVALVLLNLDNAEDLKDDDHVTGHLAAFKFFKEELGDEYEKIVNCIGFFVNEDGTFNDKSCCNWCEDGDTQSIPAGDDKVQTLNGTWDFKTGSDRVVPAATMQRIRELAILGGVEPVRGETRPVVVNNYKPTLLDKTGDVAGDVVDAVGDTVGGAVSAVGAAADATVDYVGSKFKKYNPFG
jgi:hypothetical protein